MASSDSNNAARAGLLLINLGTPDAPTADGVRRFLREFLSDRRVVDLPRALWLPILHGLILPLRPRRVARQYAQIWTAEGSPLLVHSRRLAEALAAELRVPVALGMRYGRPTIGRALAELRAQGVQRLAVLPLYPQYSRTTTASALDGLGTALQAAGWDPARRIIEDYHADPHYVAALADSVRDHWQQHGRGERLLISFHGIPQRYSDGGDPYQAQCHATAAALAHALELKEPYCSTVFQSRMGRVRWSRPYLNDALQALPAGGVRTVDVVCPGFPADCLETLEEIALRSRALFERAGGRSLRYIPALNAQPRHAGALARLLRPLLARSV